MADDGAGRRDKVLQAARSRRERLRAAMDELEQAAAAAQPGPEHGWRSRMQRAAVALADTWREHVAETEADDGSFEQVMAVAPRLSNTVARLRADHEDVPGAIDRLVTLAGSDADPQAVRDEALAVFSRLATHRQVGADLLFEAYHVDIGPAD